MAGVFIILLVLFLIVEVLLDVYIVVAFFYQEYKDKKKR
jgi:phage shock protein PspC (stress-responsive transcriptional regulator)